MTSEAAYPAPATNDELIEATASKTATGNEAYVAMRQFVVHILCVPLSNCRLRNDFKGRDRKMGVFIGQPSGRTDL